MIPLRPFAVDWHAAQIGEVLERVRAYPWPPAPQVDDGWAYGCDAAFLRRLCDHWLDGYDWRAAQAELNRFPQFTARIEDFDLHFVHVVGEAGGKRPLLLSHGWPGSHYEFWGAIEKLAFPSRHGGAAADAFDVVVPSLPGFGFSSKPARPFGQRQTARLFDTLMTEALGYERYLAQGGDWGGLITACLGFDHAAHVRGIHLNMALLRPFGGPQTPEEIAWADANSRMANLLGAYLRVQVSKPQSMAWLGAGNPVGQAAWIVERFYDWSDHRDKPFEAVFSLDQLLTNVMIYVMTGSFTTGAWYYRALIEGGGLALKEGERCETPTAYANFPGDSLYQSPPRSYVERIHNLVRWTDQPRGGHFAAMEEPDLFVADLRDWARETA
jgi:microsomal epoxide hydrolase